MDKLVRVKWAGPNTPFVSIERLDHRIYPNKRELLALQDELNAFIEFYKADFEEPRIDYEDDLSWDDLPPRWVPPENGNEDC